MSATLQELLGRVEAASGPDRELDVDLTVALYQPTHFAVACRKAPNAGGCVVITYANHGGRPTYGRQTAERLTRSLDAALALVERVLPEWAPAIRQDARPEFEGLWNACVAKRGAPREQHSTWGPTPALALLAALIRALIAKEEP